MLEDSISVIYELSCSQLLNLMLTLCDCKFAKISCLSLYDCASAEGTCPTDITIELRICYLSSTMSPRVSGRCSRMEHLRAMVE